MPGGRGYGYPFCERRGGTTTGTPPGSGRRYAVQEVQSFLPKSESAKNSAPHIHMKSKQNIFQLTGSSKSAKQQSKFGCASV
jgi:hypothetical protein